MLVCSQCAHDNPADARFCNGCGEPLHAAAPAEQRKVVTAIFCDVTGSTSMGEQLDPEVLRTIMGDFYDRGRAAVARHEGTVEKFIGDALLAVFGAPIAREDDALRAVRAALEIHTAVAELATDVLVRHGVQLAVRIGMNTGEAVVGASRAGGSFATGDAVNTAARLEQAAAPGETLLGQATYLLVKDDIVAEAVDPLHLRGKADATAAWRLVGLDAGGGERVVRPETPLLGRDRERRILDEALARVVESDSGGVVTVLGDAGLGKTRLITEFVDSLDPQVRTLQGRCLSYGEGITFYPLIEIIRQAVGLAGGEPIETVDAALSAALAVHPDAAAAVRQLAPLVGGAGEPGSLGDVIWAVQALVDRLTADTAAVLVIDDVHWAEPALLDVVEAVVRAARELPLMTIVLARPEFLAQRSTWAAGLVNATVLQLEPLTTSDVVQLVKALGVVSEDAAQRISATAEGNPLFLEQLAAHVAGHGDQSGSDVPPTLRALLAARLDQLGEAEREVVAAASVIGQVFHVDEVSDLTELGAERVLEVLDALVSRQVVRRSRRDGAGAFRFRHLLVQEAAYERQSKASRAAHHRRYAEWIRAHPGEAGGESDVIVGYHLEQGARLLAELSAGDDEAHRLADRASSALEAAAYRRELTDWRGASRLLERAADLAADEDRKARLVLRACADAIEGLDYDGRAESLRQVRDAAASRGAEDVAAVAEAGRLAAECATTPDGDISQLAETSRRAFDLAMSSQYRWGALAARRFEVFADNMVGQWARMAAGNAEVARLAAQSPQDLGWYAEARRAIPGCERWGVTPVGQALESAEALAAEFADSPTTQARMASVRAVLLAMAGRGDEARDRLGPRPTSAGRELVFWTFGAVWVNRYAVSSKRAADLAADVAAITAADGDVAHSSTLFGLSAAFAAEAGDERAAEQATELCRQTSPADDTTSQAFWRAAATILAGNRGDLAAARMLTDEALHWMDMSDQLNEAGEVRRWCSLGLRAAGDGAAADGLLRDAAQRFRAKGNAVMLARCEAELADAARPIG